MLIFLLFYRGGSREKKTPEAYKANQLRDVRERDVNDLLNAKSYARE